MQFVMTVDDVEPKDADAFIAEAFEALSLLDHPINELRPKSRSNPEDFADLPKPGTQRHRVLVTLLGNPNGYTRDELADVTGLADSAVDPRVYELILGGFAMTTDEYRETQYGEQAVVVCATEKAKTKTYLKPKAWWL